MFKGIFEKNAVDKNCRICKKTFCCAECRDLHVDKVHPGLNGSCFLCASKTLPMRQFESEKLDLKNEQLLCHIIDKHLPLHCRLCGDTFKSKEDFKFFGACKWWSAHCLTSPVGFGYHEKKLKRNSMSDSDYNDNKFYTPSEIYRTTSTPMFAGQKANIEYPTPCFPDFSLKTPKMNSSSSVQRNRTTTIYESQSSEIRDTEFFSFSTHITNENTPFKISKDQFARSNSGKKLNIMEEREEIAADKTAIVNENQILSPVDMDLTNLEGGILRDSPQLDPICEEPDETPEIVKKVRFSDEHKILPMFEEQMESCVKSILNTSAEDDEFHDARAHLSNIKNAKDVTTEHPTKIIENEENEKEHEKNDKKEDEKEDEKEDKKENEKEDKKDAKYSQQEDKVCTLEKSLQNCLKNDLHIKIIQGNMKEEDEKEKENRSSEINSVSATTNQQSTRMMMMVLMENNSRSLDAPDWMPLISSGLKKLQEEIMSGNYSAPDMIKSSDTTSKLHRQSLTKLQMTVSTVENYSMNTTATTATTTTTTTTDCQEMQIVQSSSAVAQNEDKNNERNGGFFSSFTQALKYTLKIFSVPELDVPPNSIEASKEVQRQENVEKSTVTPELSNEGSSSSSSTNSTQIRSGKRVRDEMSPKRDSCILALENRSPLPKRHKQWYTMIKGRKPIDRMRSNRATSSRGVSTETQIFSQGSLTVGDTVLPLPARAHQSTQTE